MSYTTSTVALDQRARWAITAQAVRKLYRIHTEIPSPGKRKLYQAICAQLNYLMEKQT